MDSEGGKARKASLTPEQRKAIASAGSKARWAKVKERLPAPRQEPVQAAS